MRKSKYFWLAGVCLLLVGLGANVNEAESSKRVAQGPIKGDTVTVNARQISDGQIGFDFGTKSDTNFGLGFLGQTSGDLPGTLTMSLNVTLPPETNGTGSSRSITGGLWSLPVFMTEPRSEFVGAIYGTIVQGDITPTQNPDKSEVFMILTIGGGTFAYEGAVGRAVFVGTLSVDSRGQGSELEGTLQFNTD